MNNFEKLLPSIKALFGEKWDWTPSSFAELYRDAMSCYDCSDICPVGFENCTRMMGVKPYSECKTDEEYDESWLHSNGKCCEDILTEWFEEECEDES